MLALMLLLLLSLAVTRSRAFPTEAFRKVHPSHMSFSWTARDSTVTSSYDDAVSRLSKLVYGSNNEHPNSEKLILQALPTKNARVLTICGGADNFLSLLAHDRVDSVTCVDMNPYQLALGELKLALACSDLTTADILMFLGMDKSLSNCEKRLKIFESVVEPQLPLLVSQLLRADLIYEIEMGIAQFGSEINYFRYLHRELAKLGFLTDDLWRGSVDLEKFQRVCAEGFGTLEESSKAMFLEESLPKTYKDKFERCMQTFYPVMYQAVADPAFERTFNKAIMLKGRYDEDSLPDWLTPMVRKRIRQRRNNVTFVNTPIEQVVSTANFDLISTSNLFDWMELEDGASILSKVANQLSDDGCMLVRKGFTPAKELVALVTNCRPFHRGVTPDDLAKVDFSHFWFKNPDGFAVLTRK